MTSRSAPAVHVPAAFEIHGHRGARGRYPENTIDGLLRAVADGADALETDLLLTRDGVLILHHNFEPNPDTTRDAEGRWVHAAGAPIVLRTMPELATLDVGRLRPGTEYASHFPEQEARDGARIPTFAEALIALDDASHERVRWNLEIKIATERPEQTATPEAVADATLAALRAHRRGIETRTMIQSFDWRVVRRVIATAPEIPCGCLTDPATVGPRDGAPSPFTAGLDVRDFGGSVARLAHAAGARYWTPNFRMITAADVAEAHALGLRVVPWTVNTPEDLRAIVAMGVDGLITDYPDRLGRA